MGLFDGIGGIVAGANPVGAIGAIGGALLSGGFNYLGQREANQANAQEAQANREWMQWMSNSAHRREVEDLKAAGLNPIISAKGGGANTPSGAIAHMENALGPAANSAIDAMRLYKEIQQVDSQAKLNLATGAAAVAAANKDMATAKGAELNNEIVSKTMKHVVSQQEAKGIQAEYDKKYGQFDAITRRMSNGLDAANSAKDLVTPNIIRQLPKGLFKTKDGKSIFRKDTGERMDLP